MRYIYLAVLPVSAGAEIADVEVALETSLSTKANEAKAMREGMQAGYVTRGGRFLSEHEIAILQAATSAPQTSKARKERGKKNPAKAMAAAGIEQLKEVRRKKPSY